MVKLLEPKTLVQAYKLAKYYEAPMINTQAVSSYGKVQSQTPQATASYHQNAYSRSFPKSVTNVGVQRRDSSTVSTGIPLLTYPKAEGAKPKGITAAQRE